MRLAVLCLVAFAVRVGPARRMDALSVHTGSVLGQLSKVTSSRSAKGASARFLPNWLSQVLINAVTVHVGTRTKMSGYPTYQALELTAINALSNDAHLCLAGHCSNRFLLYLT